MDMDFPVTVIIIKVYVMHVRILELQHYSQTHSNSSL